MKEAGYVGAGDEEVWGGIGREPAQHGEPKSWVVRQEVEQVSQVHNLLGVAVGPYHMHWASLAILDYKVSHPKVGDKRCFL